MKKIQNKAFNNNVVYRIIILWNNKKLLKIKVLRFKLNKRKIAINTY